jgi:hypothetical protein
MSSPGEMDGVSPFSDDQVPSSLASFAYVADCSRMVSVRLMAVPLSQYRRV